MSFSNFLRAIAPTLLSRRSVFREEQRQMKSSHFGRLVMGVASKRPGQSVRARRHTR